MQYRTLQGLMASSIQVLPLELLRMRAFMKWVLSLHLSPLRDLCRSVTVTRACTAAVRHWRSTDVYAQGTPLGVDVFGWQRMFWMLDGHREPVHFARENRLNGKDREKLLSWAGRRSQELPIIDVPLLVGGTL